MEQSTEEWFAIKAGIPSASNFDKLLTVKGEPSKQRTKYMYTLAGEKITGKKEETYQNAAMTRGIEMEAEARNCYDMIKGYDVKQVGFCMDDNRQYGCSPDGLVSEDGLVEIKCPLMATQVGYLLENKLPTDYFQQCQGQLFVTGRKWLDFVSYFPGLKPFITRVTPDKKFHAALKKELDLFVTELNEIAERIR